MSVKREPVKQEIPAPEEWDEIPLFCCTQEEINETRHHILKFQSKNFVDPVSNFKLPIRLHRKDPKNLQFQLTRAEIDQRKKMNDEVAKLEADLKTRRDGGEDDEGEEGVVANEVDEKKVDKFDRFQKPEVDMSQVAPDGGARKPKGKKLFKKQTRQITLMDEGKRKLRYEEYYPWVMEDYDGKNTWVGSYEAGNSDTYVLFVLENDKFKMIPAEKVYKFTQRNKYATLTLEEAEAKMEQKTNVPRWLMRHMENDTGEGGVANDSRFKRANNKIRTVVGAPTDGGSRDSDHDDLDFDEEFADDEEAPIMDGDMEENKLSEQRMKKEMLKANTFQDASEEDDDDDLFGDRQEDKAGKKLRKTLIKAELKVYETDEEENPYLSSDDLESSSESDRETVKVKEEDAKEDKETSPKKGILKRGRPKKQVFVKYNKDSLIIIKAPQAALSMFPVGEWNPLVPKRVLEIDESQFKKGNKRLKLALNSPSMSPYSGQTSPSAMPSVKSESPVFTGVPVDADSYTSLVTPEDVIEAVTEGASTTKELLNRLRDRIHAHPENKKRVIEYVKKYLKLVDGKLVVK
ncbi:hypothetical protein BABINDRAFT_160911 [Babjeviella inositovora NRRL Y-12698]|uniref:Transcription initiation factor IIF subunit alpha n=1 Tax=Babjeviella inositovora NRRL Y-12698 TaxID=984486 RepID=A0A1E3QSK5_9ASCO|nr:uncharacterized protein BABINDRAFT_160911 [Babjeviella inositovora NRRL Y-12698]ODQ80671.1 hypothetical protein BABINDRAFT_160911 [Babjeviella inositovora NRRL Y-12698]